ncbi:hypothetical protein WS53_07440 [Burkholderia territorii]|nr:hypothetical protein WS53_07440 [Burkholderia territorii]
MLWALAARSQMKHGVMLIMTHAVFHNGIFSCQRGNVLIVGYLIKRYTIAAGIIDHGAMGDYYPFVE